MFGFLKGHKCIEVVFDALKEILKKRSHVHFFIAGAVSPTAKEKDRQYVNSLIKRIDELGIGKNVIFPNKFFPNEDVPYLLSSADIILFPYYEEDRSASGSFHLAIGAKRAVVASRIPKFEELKNICDELLVLPYNSDGIAKICLRLFDDERFKNYVLKKTDEYRRKTSWEAVAKRHIELYMG